MMFLDKVNQHGGRHVRRLGPAIGPLLWKINQVAPRGRFLLLTIALLLTSCATERITCWDKNGQITYMGGFEQANRYLYIVNVADGVRDSYPKQNCMLHDLAEEKG